MQVRSVEVRRHAIGAALMLLATIFAGQAQALSGTQAGSAISSANAFVQKANASKCADKATREALERQGRAIIGELQGLTSTAVNTQKSDISAALINASVRVSEAMHVLDEGCAQPEPEPPHRIVRNVTMLPVAPLAPIIPFTPYVGTGISGIFGSGNWVEPDSDTSRKIDLSGVRGEIVVGFWYWRTWSGPPFDSQEAANDYDDCWEIGFESEYCWDMWGDPSDAEASARLAAWSDYKHGLPPGTTHRANEEFRKRFQLGRIKEYSETHAPTPQFLFGIENDYSFGSVDGSTGNGCVVSCRISNTQLDTLLFKGGVRYGRITPYLAVGPAFGDIHMAAGNILPGNTAWNTGWAAGLGTEILLSRHFSLDLRYLHTDLGSGNCGPATCGGNANFRWKEDSVSAALHYQFNGVTGLWR